MEMHGQRSHTWLPPFGASSSPQPLPSPLPRPPFRVKKIHLMSEPTEACKVRRIFSLIWTSQSKLTPWHGGRGGVVVGSHFPLRRYRKAGCRDCHERPPPNLEAPRLSPDLPAALHHHLSCVHRVSPCNLPGSPNA